MKVADKDPKGWQVFELSRGGVWDVNKCAWMPTVRIDTSFGGKVRV